MIALMKSWATGQHFSADLIETPLPKTGQTATGYGAKIPSPYKVKLKGNGRWYRVYIACFGNASTAYIGKPGAWIATVEGMQI